jgi:hypothetical protein
VPTRTSRCSRFLTTLPSGTRWKNSRRPAPEGQCMQTMNPDAQAAASDRNRPKWRTLPVAAVRRASAPRYPKRATRSGSTQSKVTWICLTSAMDPPERRGLRTSPRARPLARLWRIPLIMHDRAFALGCGRAQIVWLCAELSGSARAPPAVHNGGNARPLVSQADHRA